LRKGLVLDHIARQTHHIIRKVKWRLQVADGVPQIDGHLPLVKQLPAEKDLVQIVLLALLFQHHLQLAAIAPFGLDMGDALG
jgi:aspartate carbamoyltransferase regulatory subunit